MRGIEITDRFLVANCILVRRTFGYALQCAYLTGSNPVGGPVQGFYPELIPGTEVPVFQAFG